jgi:hypothetical protein
MEEILASIRRILNEDPVSEAAAAGDATAGDAATGDPATGDPDGGVLLLDKSMMRDAAEVAHGANVPEPGAPMTEPPPAVAQTDMVGDPAPEHAPAPPGEAAPDLVAPEAAAAAAMAMGNLMRTLAADRRPKVWSEGPTLEDLVRVTLRPLLKEWLDTNLPPIVERLVRTEIERVVGRVIP